jgi:hypothetical protein
VLAWDGFWESASIIELHKPTIAATAQIKNKRRKELLGYEHNP